MKKMNDIPSHQITDNDEIAVINQDARKKRKDVLVEKYEHKIRSLIEAGQRVLKKNQLVSDDLLHLINSQNCENGNTSLHNAVYAKDFMSFLLLLTMGANPKVLNAKKQSALSIITSYAFYGFTGRSIKSFESQMVGKIKDNTLILKNTTVGGSEWIKKIVNETAEIQICSENVIANLCEKQSMSSEQVMVLLYYLHPVYLSHPINITRFTNLPNEIIILIAQYLEHDQKSWQSWNLTCKYFAQALAPNRHATAVYNHLLHFTQFFSKQKCFTSISHSIEECFVDSTFDVQKSSLFSAMKTIIETGEKFLLTDQVKKALAVLEQAPKNQLTNFVRAYYYYFSGNVKLAQEIAYDLLNQGSLAGIFLVSKDENIDKVMAHYFENNEKISKENIPDVIELMQFYRKYLILSDSDHSHQNVSINGVGLRKKENIRQFRSLGLLVLLLRFNRDAITKLCLQDNSHSYHYGYRNLETIKLFLTWEDTTLISRLPKEKLAKYIDVIGVRSNYDFVRNRSVEFNMLYKLFPGEDIFDLIGTGNKISVNFLLNCDLQKLKKQISGSLAESLQKDGFIYTLANVCEKLNSVGSDKREMLLDKNLHQLSSDALMALRGWVTYVCKVECFKRKQDKYFDLMIRFCHQYPKLSNEIINYYSKRHKISRDVVFLAISSLMTECTKQSSQQERPLTKAQIKNIIKNLQVHNSKSDPEMNEVFDVIFDKVGNSEMSEGYIAAEPLRKIAKSNTFEYKGHNHNSNNDFSDESSSDEYNIDDDYHYSGSDDIKP